jgi:Acyl-protein synthetase, LuxE
VLNSGVSKRPTDDDRAANELDRRIEAFVASADETDAAFERLALDLFAYQFANNAPYRALCEHIGRSPANIATWRDVPAVSTSSFADARLACFPPERTMLTFVSSGTTSARARPSVHELENTLLYDASLLAYFKQCVMPDRDAMRMLLLSPSFTSAPRSSLAYMLTKVHAAFASSGGFFITDDVLDMDGIASALRKSAEPVLVFGTAFAFVHFLDHCKKSGWRFSLAAGSRIVETGGFKGKSRSVGRDELYDDLVHVFGVRRDFCIAEYGMCELGSQWYDASLSDSLAGREPREQLKIGPHWTRTLVVDPLTAQEAPSGTAGLLRCFDLSNRGSVAAVLTGDLAVAREGGFEYIARSSAAPPKGCSIAIDTALGARA